MEAEYKVDEDKTQKLDLTNKSDGKNEKKEVKMARHVTVMDEDWEMSLPHMFFMCPEKELKNKLEDHDQDKDRMMKEFEQKTRELEEEKKKELKPLMSTFLQNRERLINVLVDSMPRSDEWDILGSSIAAQKLKELDGQVEEVEASEAAYMSSSMQLIEHGGKNFTNFKWKDDGKEYRSNELAFDQISCLFAVAIWYMVCAAKLGRAKLSKAQGLLPMARYAFDFFRVGAGKHSDMYNLYSKAQIETIMPKSTIEGISLMYSICIADAQSIALSRAILKDSSESLISSLAFGARDELSNMKVGSKGSYDKWTAYAEYKKTFFQSLGYIYQGLAVLKDEEGGIARKCSLEALRLYDELLRFGSTFDKSTPRTNNEHEGFDNNLLKFLKDTDRRIERENAIVHMKPLPAEVPINTPVKKIVKPISTQGLPTSTNAEHQVIDIHKGDIQEPEEVETQSCSVVRWLVLIITCPLLLIITIVGMLVYVVLLPVKCFCCPLGVIAQLIWNIVEWMLKAPLHAMRWAAGHKMENPLVTGDKMENPPENQKSEK